MLALILLSSFLPFWRTTYASSPSITLSPNSGSPFDQITVSGTGFTPGQTISVNLYYPGYSTSLSIDNGCTTVATDGTFQCTYFRIPNVSPNSYTVTASDSIPESASASFTVTSAPYTFSVTPTSGAAGSSITITGGGTVGFYPGCSGPIYFGTNQIGRWNSLTGSFVVVATVPNVSPGTYAVYTEDCISDYGFASFTVTSGTTTTTATASLGDGFGVSDSYVPGSLAPLSDGVPVSDQYVSPATAPMTDGVTVTDTYVKSPFAPLTDSVTLIDAYVRPITAPLNELVSVVDTLVGLPPSIPKLTKIIFTDPPGYFVVNVPGGGQIGFDGQGQLINSIGCSTCATYDSSTQTETVILTNPTAGSYEITVYGTGPGSATVTIQTFDSNNHLIGDQQDQVPTSSGSTASFFAAVSSDGSVVISSTPTGVPEFPGSIMAIVLAILFVSLNYMRKRKRHTVWNF